MFEIFGDLFDFNNNGKTDIEELSAELMLLDDLEDDEDSDPFTDYEYPDEDDEEADDWDRDDFDNLDDW